jgi:hypothetical protein
MEFKLETEFELKVLEAEQFLNLIWIYLGSKLVWKILINFPKLTMAFLSQIMNMDQHDCMVILEVPIHALIRLVSRINTKGFEYIPTWTRFDPLWTSKSYKVMYYRIQGFGYNENEGCYNFHGGHCMRKYGVSLVNGIFDLIIEVTKGGISSNWTKSSSSMAFSTLTICHFSGITTLSLLFVVSRT